MENEADKLIDEQFSKLPENLQRAIRTVPWAARVKEMSDRNKIAPEKISDIERETMFVLYGIEAADDYLNNLIREVGIEPEIAERIAEEIYEQIFQAISDEIKEKQSLLPEIAPEIHPMIEPGETVHDVPHKKETPASMPPMPEKIPPTIVQPVTAVPPTTPIAPKPQAPAPNNAYSGGADPYREPIE